MQLEGKPFIVLELVQLKCKRESMERHLDDVPGPWFDELLQPGGWISDLRDRLNTL